MRINAHDILEALNGQPMKDPSGALVQVGPLVSSVLCNQRRQGITPAQLTEQIGLADRFARAAAATTPGEAIVVVPPEEASLVRELAMEGFAPLVAQRIRDVFDPPEPVVEVVEVEDTVFGNDTEEG